MNASLIHFKVHNKNDACGGHFDGAKGFNLRDLNCARLIERTIIVCQIDRIGGSN